jgi:hypothetical protein
VCITDQDVAEKAAQIMGGLIHGPYQYDDRKPIFHATLERREEVLKLVKRLQPHMGERRQQAIAEMLEIAELHPPQRKWQRKWQRK